jgi:hypothetical protein
MSKLVSRPSVITFGAGGAQILLVLQLFISRDLNRGDCLDFRFLCVAGGPLLVIEW